MTKTQARAYDYESRVMWNTALPLVPHLRENNHLQNRKRVELFDSLGFYGVSQGAVIKRNSKGGRGVRGLTVELVERLLSRIGTDSYVDVIRNLFKQKYMTPREVKHALRYCSAVKGKALTDNEITLLIKEWI